MNSKSRSFLRLFITATLLFAVAVAFAGCGKSSKQKIIGKWAFGSSLIYEFTENGEVSLSGTGSMEIPKQTDKYSVPDNETLVLESPKMKGNLKIKFTDNDNTLTMINESGTTHTLKRLP